LVGNAIKFTETGEVTMTISAERLGDTGRLRVDIRDTGIGLSPEQLGRLFQPFVQADDSMSRKYGGTGLGLVISQRLARLMGGDITITSEPGLGSTFTVWLNDQPLAGAEMLEGLTESTLGPIAAMPQTKDVRLAGR